MEINHRLWTIVRRHSIILKFRLGPAAMGRGPCGIDRELFRFAKSRVKKIGKSLYNRNTLYFLARTFLF